jgi:hypothetical protein
MYVASKVFTWSILILEIVLSAARNGLRIGLIDRSATKITRQRFRKRLLPVQFS